MIIYKIQHKQTKLFLKKKLLYWNENSRWGTIGTIWTSLSDVNKYLSQFVKLHAWSTGVDASEWQVVEFIATESNSTPVTDLLKIYYEH